MELIQLIGTDIIETLKALRAKDFYGPGLFAMWSMFLFIPLKQVDRRDRITLSVYCLYSVFVAMMVMTVVPKTDIDSIGQLLWQIFICISVAFLAAARWILQPKKKKPDKEIQDAS